MIERMSSKSERRGSRRGQNQSDPELTVTLSSGALASMVHDGEGWALVVDGTPQAHVTPDDPERISFGYMRHMSHVIDLAWSEREAITALHLGAGALTIPRYIESTRPGSRQQVIELEPAVVDLVRRVAPLPAHAPIRVRYGDAREQIGRLPAGLNGSVNLVVVDIFAGPQTPAHVTSVEFFERIPPLLAPNAIVLVNVADGHDLRFARSEIATLDAVFGHVSVIADPAVLKGRRFGNIIAIASPVEPEIDGIARRVAGEYPPTVFQNERQTSAFGASASPVRDADATPSPLPGRNVFIAERSGGWT